MNTLSQHSPPAVKLIDLSKTFSYRNPPKRVIDQMNLSIPPGQIVALLGESGAGKSTLLKMIAGQLPPTTGRVQILGTDPAVLPGRGEACRLFLAEWEGFDRDRPILDALQIHLHKDQYLFDRLSDAFGINDLLHETANTLPQTMLQHIILVSAFSYNAPLLLIDELPGLGHEAAQILCRWVPDRIHEMDRTLIYATRNPSVALTISDRFIVLSHGRITFDSSGQELMKRDGPFTYSFRLRGYLDLGRSTWFDGFRITYQDGCTVLTGEVIDQPSLYGILGKFRDLGLTIVAFQQDAVDQIQLLKTMMSKLAPD